MRGYPSPSFTSSASPDLQRRGRAMPDPIDAGGLAADVTTAAQSTVDAAVQAGTGAAAAAGALTSPVGALLGPVTTVVEPPPILAGPGKEPIAAPSVDQSMLVLF